MIASSEETHRQITAVLDIWIKAFLAQDVNGVRSVWDDTYDSLVYQCEEMAGPLTNWRHIKHYYREVLTKLIKKVEKFDRTGLWISSDAGGLGFAYQVSDFTMLVHGVDAPYSGSVRQTFVLRQVGGKWKVVHYHESLQTMPTPANFDLEAADAA